MSTAHLITASSAMPTGSQDKDATVRAKAVGVIGSVMAEAGFPSEAGQQELTLMLTHR